MCIVCIAVDCFVYFADFSALPFFELNLLRFLYVRCDFSAFLNALFVLLCGLALLLKSMCLVVIREQYV